MWPCSIGRLHKSDSGQYKKGLSVGFYLCNCEQGVYPNVIAGSNTHCSNTLSMLVFCSTHLADIFS